jgi:hypothetical protein
MPLGYAINRGKRYVLLLYRGNPSAEEWTNAVGRALMDPAYLPGYGFLLDRRKATGPPTTEFIRAVVAFSEAHRAVLADSRWAVVVGDAASFGMARMGQMLAVDLEIEVFTDMTEAEAWLQTRGPRRREKPQSG